MATRIYKYQHTLKLENQHTDDCFDQFNEHLHEGLIVPVKTREKKNPPLRTMLKPEQKPLLEEQKSKGRSPRIF